MKISFFCVVSKWEMEDTSIQLFDNMRIRTQRDAEQEKWYFSIVDIVSALTESVDATAYWRKLKMPAADGKMRMTDVVDQEQVNSRKAGCRYAFMIIGQLNSK